ncbi:tetratricopeptide repeat protein [Paraburkholderia sp. SIMBA_049]
MSTFDKAIAAHRAGCLEDAARGYRALLQIKPKHADALHLLGLIVWEQGATDEAERLLRRAIAVREDAIYLTNLGNLLAELAHMDDAEAALRRAVAIAPGYALAHYNLGTLLQDAHRFDEAESAMRNALECDAQLREAWTNLGKLLSTLKRHSEAVDAYRRALLLDPARASAHRDLAVAYLQAQRFHEAEEALRNALQIDPQLVDAHADLAAVYAHALRWNDAESACRNALALDAGHLEARLNLVRVLQHTNRLGEAETAVRNVIATGQAIGFDDTSQSQRAFTHADALHLLGRILWQRGETGEAERHLRMALSIRENAAYMTDLGNLFNECARHADAGDVYRAALELVPDDAVAHRNLAVALIHMHRFAEAEAALNDSLRLGPDSADTYTSLVAVYSHTRRWKEAEAACRRALALDENHRYALYNLAGVMMHTDRLDEAEALFRQGIARETHNANERFSLGQILLSQGRYEEGWMLHEARLDPDHEMRTMPWHDAVSADLPEWRGEPLEGKTMVVVSEQGFGDSLQFCRYLPMLKRLGLKRLNLVCPSALVTLMETVDGVDACVTSSRSLDIPAHDYWCFMMSLPWRFNTTVDTIPADVPYLHAPADRLLTWRERLPSEGFKVGLVWAGNPRPDMPGANAVDRRRSLDARAFLPLLEVPGLKFVSLQLGDATRPQLDSIPHEIRPLDLMGDVRDFADTAAIIECLDLVISVDTSTAHVAGALNKPVWILSRYDACWRWLRERDDSPWYPSVRLFRQTTPGDWGDVIERVAIALKKQY